MTASPHSQLDANLTREARTLPVFRGTLPIVARAPNGQGYIVSPTDYGSVCMIPLLQEEDEGGLLVAAERPPAQVEIRNPAVLDWLERMRMKPWAVLEDTSDPRVALHRLDALTHRQATARSTAADDACEPEELLPPYAFLLPERPELIGRERQRRAEQTTALVAEAASGGAIAAVTGPDGIGRRTLAARVAATLSLQAVELPCSRLTGARMLATPEELILDTLIKACESPLAGQTLLVLSDAQELVQSLAGSSLRRLLPELMRTPVLLLAAPGGEAEIGDVDRVIEITLPGLSTGEAQELLQNELGEQTVFTAAALEMLLRASRGPGGINPARLLYLVRASLRLLALDRDPGAPMTFYPDDAAAAAKIAGLIAGAR